MSTGGLLLSRHEAWQELCLQKSMQYADEVRISHTSHGRTDHGSDSSALRSAVSSFVELIKCVGGGSSTALDKSCKRLWSSAGCRGTLVQKRKYTLASCRRRQTRLCLTASGQRCASPNDDKQMSQRCYRLLGNGTAGCPLHGCMHCKWCCLELNVPLCLQAQRKAAEQLEAIRQRNLEAERVLKEANERCAAHIRCCHLVSLEQCPLHALQQLSIDTSRHVIRTRLCPSHWTLCKAHSDISHVQDEG